MTRFNSPDLLSVMKKGGLEVFDFTEEDELPELISEKRLSKFKNPNLQTNNSVMECEELPECGRFFLNWELLHYRNNFLCLQIPVEDCWIRVFNFERKRSIVYLN